MARLLPPLMALTLVTLSACLLDTTGRLRPDAATDADDDACVPTTEVCNGLDDDCDGEADNDFDLLTDPANCGECGNECTPRSNAVAVACAAGACRIVECVSSDVYCRSGYADCDHRFDNGCEACLNSDLACGDCETRCRADTQCRRADGGYACRPRS